VSNTQAGDRGEASESSSGVEAGAADSLLLLLLLL